MQYDKNYEGTESWKAITVKQPLADDIAYGRCDHIVRSKNSPRRGEVLIVSSPHPKGERSGMVVGIAELVSVKKVNGGYLYRFENPRRVIEMPCQKCTMKGEVWDCFYTQGAIMEYPRINLRNL